MMLSAKDLLNVTASSPAMAEALDTTLLRWRLESAELERQGAYDWLCGRISAQRVLEIGCGFGASTVALARHGKSVFVLDNRMDCLEATQKQVPDASYGVADVHHYDERLLNDLNEFAPEAVVCWLAGAPADALPTEVPAQYAVMQHRLLFQQAVVKLAARLPAVKSVHLADRTAFPWKMRAAGQETMAKMISTAVITDLPFTVSVADVRFRKLDGGEVAQAKATSLPALVPLIGEACLRRRSS